MKNKLVFIDVDGTLVNDNGIVPKSAEIAIKKARSNGHYMFLCTGRSKAELFDNIMNIGFDGIIGAAGGYIEFSNKVIMHKKVKSDDIKHLVSYFNENNIDFYLESNGGLFASKNCKKHLRELISDNHFSDNYFINCLIEGEDLIRNDVNKISFLGSPISIEIIQKEFGKKFNIISSTVPAFGENSGELSVPGIHKATAIEILLKHLNFPKEDTFAYGDGINDIEMLEYVNTGIAMGNANDKLKAIADDVTNSHDENGIYNSFKKYNLI